MKAQATIYKGIEFVSLHKLPTEQQLLLQHNPAIEHIKILVDGKVIHDCIQYSIYTTWYTAIFEKSIAPVPAKQIESSLLEPAIALSKV